MNYRYMGKTGPRVSERCLGAMTFGRESSEEESVQILDRFAEAGGNFIDTADVYSQGTSEEILGRWLGGQQPHRLAVAKGHQHGKTPRLRALHLPAAAVQPPQPGHGVGTAPGLPQRGCGHHLHGAPCAAAGSAASIAAA